MTAHALLGLLVLNLALSAAGTAVLFGLGAVRSSGDLVRLLGLGYLVGASSLMVALGIVLVLGLPVGIPSSATIILILAAGGVAVGTSRGYARRGARTARALPRITVLAALCLGGIVLYFEALFRAARLASVQQAFDAWWFWIPKAQAIYFFGRLDPELLSSLPNPGYPPGLPALHAVAFHAMGSADDTTLHVQYWFYAAGFVAALAGTLAGRARQNIQLPTVLLVLVAPAVVERATSAYADLPLGYLVTVAGLLVAIWLAERQTWQLVAATLLLSGAMVTKREGILFAICVFVAAFACSWSERRQTWKALASSAVVAGALTVPWRIWIAVEGLPNEGPSTGVLGLLDAPERAWPAMRLVLSTIFDPGLWLVVPIVFVAAVVLTMLTGRRQVAVYAIVFACTATVAGTWVVWSETALPLSQNDAENPVVRMVGTSVLALAAFTPLLLEEAWAATEREPSKARLVGLRLLAHRSLAAWGIVATVAVLYPASALVGYRGQTLPGGLGRFPSVTECVPGPVSGEPVRLVVGYADSYQEARDIGRRARTAGILSTSVSKDGCGRLRVSVDDLPNVGAAVPLTQRARLAGLDATLEGDAD